MSGILMAMPYTRRMDACPKCGYARQAKGAVPPGQPDTFDECPRCGIVFAKFAKYHAPQAPVTEPPAQEGEPEADVGAVEGPWYLRLWDRLMELPEQPDPLKLGAQALVLAVMVVWG